MFRCISCASEISGTSRFCPECGKPVADSSETAVMAVGSTPQSTTGHSRAAAVPARVSSSEGRFAAGVLVAARYQIIGLLGKGGMGEVYRANDLTLDQAVALKFLPAAMARDAGMLARFHNEVRIARQVSHPNVCRVYDLGEADGQPYLSMEYIDGEDLGSLLRRIGRLPADKALEFARRICAGLAAAHDKGVLHRDLKPSNIMIDSQGHVFITDFGLAAVTGELREAQAREGTPAYMSPEQLAGTEVTARSDIYSLGLVLYEMFAGKRPYEAGTLAEMIRLQQQSKPVSLTTVVKDVDPAVELVIQRCLSADPSRRPASALSVAAALPGGDPLAAALAAGETPSPDVVAAAGQQLGIRPVLGLVCLAAIIAGLVAVMLIGPRVQLISKVAMEHPPEVLAEKSRDLARGLGYTARPMGAAHGFAYDLDYLQYVDHNDKSTNRWERRLGNTQPPAITFWYRESPRPLQPEAFGVGTVDVDDPPPIISGMVSVTLDPQGRLVELNAVPPQVDKTSGEVPPPDWKRLFDAAGLDMSRFSPATPQWTPLGICDSRAAWTGNLSSGRQDPVRVEAAAWRGKPIYFQIVGPWTRPARMQKFTSGASLMALAIAGLTVSGLLLVAAVLMARHNTRRGRGDQRGALRLAAFTACIYMLIWGFGGSHVAGFGELVLFFGALSCALLLAAAVWVLYMAIEPIARRRWPHSMIAWNRLLAGGIRDPLVGRDVLVGLTFGTAAALVAKLHMLVGAGAMPSIAVQLGSLTGVSGAVAGFLTLITNCVLQALSWFVLIFILRVVLRRDWLAAAAFVAIYMALNWLGTPASPALSALFGGLETALLVFMMVRFGLVALIASSFVYVLWLLFPITSDFSAWYAGTSLFALLSLAVMAALAFRWSLAGRPLFGDAEL
ncbi:MAG TPA: serine/threonine-protein kinase [Bryobacteraceae bacterium]|jgi:serine/threonine-protein kinase|nr:serine/threonine-protein kinase [Bryobacteraceae bacterium]